MKLNAIAMAICLTLATTAVSAKDYSKAEIESIVHDYLLANPEVIMEASNKYKEQQAKLMQGQQQKLIESIYTNKAIPSSGAKNGKNKIVEFFDYNCGYCKKARPLLNEVQKTHPDIQYFYMEFPILSEISGMAAQIGIALYAINPELYAKYNNQLMTRSDRLTSEIQLQALVESLDPSITWKEVKALSETEPVLNTLNDIREIAKNLNVNGTPAFIVNGEIIHGAPTSKVTIEKLLK